MYEKLFNRNFTMVVIGQIISLFGNVILRFALSLYILDITGSATIFGTILAISMIPTIILSPFGGMLADRINRRNIMVALDLLTAVLIFIFSAILSDNTAVIAITIMLILLSLIQAFYQPSVQSSVPLLQKENHYVQANAVVNQVNALANLLGPILGGFLYGFFGAYPIIIISAVCFFLSAILEIFIHIPFTPLKKQGSLVGIVKNDFKVSMQFIGKEKPYILKSLLYTGAMTFFVVAIATVGMPYLIRIALGLSAELYGVTEAFMGFAGILGGIGAGILANKIKGHNLYLFISLIGILIIPIGIAFFFNVPNIIAYIIITITFSIIQFVVCIFTIFVMSSIQQKTPTSLIGKVMSYVTTVTMCSQPLGQAIYGALFDWFSSSVYLLLLITAVLIIILGFLAKKTFIHMDI